MTDHKFEPFDKVIGMNNGEWHADLFSHYNDIGVCVCVGDCYDAKECIPYTPETAHLLGTSQPYEPPKPPQEYEWGQKVEVYKNNVWVNGVISYTGNDSSYAAVVAKGDIHASMYPPDRIRPLPDDTAAH